MKPIASAKTREDFGARLETLVQAQEAVGRLENAAQSPLDVRDWIYTKAREDSGPAKERKDD